ncbi:Tox regulatory factor [Methanoculleus chikugoensis]|jgi:DtxR family Mn-dependent transcriptional regulator|uniref:Tox regulatory factor n=1 Tax=Methanoculleus chikugoensis TaxID=118126 RepID=A0A1M4MH10_9EURY|nr:metal-dependent transcriptional regulator [Methanoculleus chikugoensis]MDD4568491.1 metal-dependent transcriptional regulator [Methanoculleus chikugoensis]NMA11534.1 metal-dependent transcriptional regulator [Methanomicrobiales archaeon]SCL74175.1 Tox regulatory factor [Methanoculleus chikugoensis]
MLPSTFEDYLEAILAITESGGRAATLDEIAAALDTGKETAGTTVASLVEEGYLERADGDAVRLTGKGSSVASQVARKHRVLQCFLTEMLGVDEDAASREACTLEHGISDETIDRLSSYMDGAQSPPGRMGRCRGRDCTLLDCKEGDTVRVAMMRGPRRHRRLLDLGIFPGEIVQIRRKLPNDSVVVRVKGCDIAISPEIARSIVVESCP